MSSQPDARGVRVVTSQGWTVAWAGDHPWVSSVDDGDVLVVVDGQLHNLFHAGQSPASLVRRRYEERGKDLAVGLLGDFVVIVLDRARDTLFVCRDPLGVRPWYQASAGAQHAGASDTATLTALPWVDDSVDEQTAVGYLAGLAQSRGRTFHQGVSTLPPGSTWVSSGDDTVVTRHHRWEIRPEPEIGWDEAVYRCREVVEEAVRSRLQAANAATSELSGGLDSSAVVGTVVRLGRQDLVVGRLVFDGWHADERPYSDAVIQHWGLDAVSVAPWLPTNEEYADLTARWRRPAPDPNFTMLGALHGALQAKGRSSALTGIGGDDAFASMSHESRLVSAVQQRQVAVLRRVLREDLRDPRQGWQRSWRPLLRKLARRPRGRPPAYLSRMAVETYDLEEQFAEGVPELTGVSAIDERAEGLTSGYMAHVLEEGALVADLTGWRSSHPFLDPRVVEATYGLDPGYAIHAGEERALQIAAFGDRLPAEIRRRQDKAEFSEVMWAVGLRRRETISRIEQGPLRDRGWLDHVGFSELTTRAREGRPNAAIPLSRAESLDRWLRQVSG